MNLASKTYLAPMVLLFFGTLTSHSQETGIQVNTDWNHERHSWEAHWITHPGSLEFIEAAMPHPNGQIQLKLKMTGEDRISGNVILPEDLYGTFLWEGQTLELIPGEQQINFRG